MKVRPEEDFTQRINWLVRDKAWRKLIGQRARDAVFAWHTTAQ